MPWDCFMAERTDRARHGLRRYTFSSVEPKCPLHGFGHVATAALGECEYVGDPAMNGYHGDDWPHDDRRWPTSCDCGYTFRPEDAWVHDYVRLYRNPSTGELFDLHPNEAPIGAMWRAEWMEDGGFGGPDGICLAVMTPGGIWTIDYPSSSGGRWTRTGVPPRITARPSILVPGRYHGWLTDGVLSDDIDGNPR